MNKLVVAFMLVQFGQGSANHHRFDSVQTGQREYLVVVFVFCRSGRDA